jgi:transposase
MPNDLPPWFAVYQQSLRRPAACCFEALAQNPRPGRRPPGGSRAQGVALEVVKLPEAKRRVVLLPSRWVVERSVAWATRCRRLVKDYERYAGTLAL